MSPEERREDAELAANEWRNELRALRPEVRERTVERRTRRVWVDSGSGPGHEVLIPQGGESDG